ncbi:ABC transporter ATP-binding protein [Amygdalobacter nucleatus]|uniref:ABC transporter, ATP-binding protein n=1 Tax=Amygdalobacter nucleatus TaxID=3029274 RepID=A0A133YD62_9FIRM|nr:ABC transporter ATP-binding protein [Amygdalobacter nucleatus]KXB41132.1 ABC transporter, ATP-binding protein [Amygdalobacter nucleatus]MDF0485120.1 ABC transporter ATP-binding protein [Amygdalobacter nucleatus]MDF0486465.1 ABC transporter ATP-binding protein [Amygdalobacter nucleatus]MDF0486472.1 ABC transporter ATP-binding protein [Amygdalobacter nucleatus]MDF0486482.1 ABC transporter ATP-binding protein [Amygdalobacter nucleatus]
MKKKSTISWVMEFAGRRGGFFVGSVLLAILGVVASFIPYLLIADVVEKLITGGADWSYYLRQVTLMVVCWIIRVALHSSSTTLSHVATFTVLGGIRKQLTAKLSRIPLGSILDDHSGTYKNIIVERVDAMETTMAHIIPEFTANLLLPLIMFIYLLTIDWRMGLANLIPVVIGLFFVAGMMKGSGESFQLTLEKTKKLNDTAVEYINGIEVIKAFGKSKSSYEKFVTAAKEGASCFIDWMRRCIWWSSGSLSFTPATLLGVLPVGLLLVRGGSLTASDFITGVILSAGLVTPLVVAFSYTDDISKMSAIFGEVTEILERKDMERPAALTEQPEGSDIKLSDVRFTYKEKEVLHGVNMEIKQGDVTAIVGPSGSGKSTIARLIDSLWDVDSGSITYGGVDIRNLPLDYYASQISYVAQDNYLFDMSVLENIRLGRKGASEEDIINAAKATGCHEFILGLEHGYDTVVGGAGGHLSGGERQRICIARAMLKDAPVVILDEATAYTDPENETLVQMSVAKLVQGKTLIVIAHRLSTITSADKIFVVNEGNIEAAGTHNELIAGCPLYQKMWEAHSEARDADTDYTASAVREEVAHA